ncbi:UbiA family prenyltransferase [Rheinheimera texasensis]|uniref:UbiA family prenyltransferase n=1 Tax=Rheinheimera texasensis TaxID=306205 RepID=UPI0032B12ACD
MSEELTGCLGDHPDRSIPLVVDLDGTLLRSDLLIETGFLWLRQQPLQFPKLALWLAQGKAVLKQHLADSVTPEVTELPYDIAVLQFIREQRATGRQIILATASHQTLADKIAVHLGIFDETLATNAQQNLSGETKLKVLVQRFGERGFDYMGNSLDDLVVFSGARYAYVVNASATVRKQAKLLGNVAAVMGQVEAGAADWCQALRVHQWVKNLLIFVPLLAAHRAHDWPLLFTALLVFICFSLCASSVYLLNDLFDLPDDRHHPLKKHRPIPSGRVSLHSAVLLCPLLLVTAFGLAFGLLPAVAVLGLAAYYLLTLCYSLWLKRLVILDVVTLAALYTSRLMVGAVALGIALSFWLLAFSMFMFLSLALVKRYAELLQVRATRRSLKARGRGYFADDLHMIATLGASSGYMTVLVMALYVNDSHITQLYQRPEWIWLACPILLIWISRVWMLAHRGQMNEDPVIFALHDKASLLMALLMAAVFWMAT